MLHIADRIFNTPLLVLPAKAHTIGTMILLRMGVEIEKTEDIIEAEAAIEASRFTGTRARQGRPYALTRAQDGVALIDIQGSLVNRGAWVGSYSGQTSYEGIEAALKDAVADPEIRAIALDINSPGGEATGMFGLAEKIRSAREQKPVVAVVNDMAASAAYGLASAASEIVVSPTSVVGSIGVVMMHLDRSGEMAKAGIRPTLIHAGAHKVDGHPFGPLSEDVRADLQRSVDTFYERFIETVEAGRGRRTTAEMARATEARTYIGREAIGEGLADRVASLDQVISELSHRSPASGRTSTKGFTMDQTSGAPAANAGFTQAQMDAAVSVARADERKSERTRIEAILASDEAKGREQMAMHLAFKTDMSATEAVALLTVSPKAGSAIPTIEQRASAAEIGASATQTQPDAEAEARAGWAAAIERHNRRFS